MQGRAGENNFHFLYQNLLKSSLTDCTEPEKSFVDCLGREQQSRIQYLTQGAFWATGVAKDHARDEVTPPFPSAFSQLALTLASF